MACAHPLTAYRLIGLQDKSGKTIQWSKPMLPSDKFEEIQLPCGQCIECRLQHARIWALRLEHENSLHDSSCFVTLTYDDEHLRFTKSGLPTLCYDDMRAFLKRLRSRLDVISCQRAEIARMRGLEPPPPIRVRFFYSGEYGESTQRPHYHLILFGWFPSDAQYLKKSSDYKLFSSKILDDCWSLGYTWTGSVTWDSLQYVAGYVTKKMKGRKEDKEKFYRGRAEEKSVMSRRPGIGRGFIEKYMSDVFPLDHCVTSKGFELKPPRYYDEQFFKGLEYDEKRIFLETRQKRLDAVSPCLARLLDREKIHQQQQRKRDLI